ncbi:MAG: hypothetical protein IVW57_18900, partial [Ktedonobacterales bacterium]|nr:hypothetical protein [Ktedonobacterales bacterium]
NTRKTLGTRLHNAAVGLDLAAGRAMRREEVITALERALAERLGARLTPATWRAAELTTAERIERERFAPLVEPPPA